MALSKTKTMAAGAAMYAFLFAGSGIENRDNDNKCSGTERWDVKVAADERADEIKQRPKVISLEELISYNTDTLAKSGPRTYSETFTYTLKNIFITDAIREDDNDIHLVIEDGHKHTLIAEIPDTNCKVSEDSRFATQIDKSRKTFMRYQDTYRQYVFDITGVFFRDKPHGQTGKAPNNVELHPVIALKKVKKFNP
jgi:hypothetical protein